VLVLHRTDSTLPFEVSGWTRRAECYKEDNGYQCLNVSDCTSRFWRLLHHGSRTSTVDSIWHRSCLHRTASSSEPSSYSIQHDQGRLHCHPGWAILTTLRGANTSAPVRAWANKGCDNDDNDSLFPSVDGRKGDMLLLSQSFDDFVSKGTFSAPPTACRPSATWAIATRRASCMAAS
jgi:hypothetical protein